MATLDNISIIDKYSKNILFGTIKNIYLCLIHFLPNFIKQL